ncbi:hypothetical protein NSK11_contig00016-0028 [Nocardia seriolae]|uniref:Uncharacterized protein n=1 Tax=Nocardia seriolae TaxID=37332 RepID=A0ABC9YPD2_9NOCA|nr:hypothetical protein NSERKGN1266_70000 [Nocardia seriolae]BEK93229.1 hypothetical protein NSER024013_11350 [Nocardia seriolae]GAM45247.1 hypothetical protein NS07_v2contig00013-0028 [Nocardia seriolae]GAP27269.1 hypothetical protein NSK11_contig00016-0028 [Nocardia seriolae]GEM22725.1 hypothetical protein NS2_09640 [Nocardia seriolae NBRC 15557]
MKDTPERVGRHRPPRSGAECLLDIRHARSRGWEKSRAHPAARISDTAGEHQSRGFARPLRNPTPSPRRRPREGASAAPAPRPKPTGIRVKGTSAFWFAARLVLDRVERGSEAEEAE